jgi:hypothetical protein
MKQNINIKSMNKIIYLVILPFIITSCGSKDKKENSGTASNSVNSAMVDVYEVVGVGKVEPEKEIISLATPTGGIVKDIYK